MTSNKVQVELRVGMLDVSLAQLVTKDHHLIEFPTLLLPNDVKAGSIITLTCERDDAGEKEDARAFSHTQSAILERFANNVPKAPVLRVHNTTQTSAVLEWDPIDAATADITSLALYKNGQRLGVIPTPLKRTSTKLSNLGVDNEYTFHLVLTTSAGTFESNKLSVHTHKMTDLSGITVCVGSLTNSVISLEDLEESVSRIGAKPLQDVVQLDTTHFVCTNEAGKQAQRAKDLNIPVVRPEWLKACETERRLVGVRQYYISADPKLMPPTVQRDQPNSTATTPATVATSSESRHSSNPSTPTPETPSAPREVTGRSSSVVTLDSVPLDDGASVREHEEHEEPIPEQPEAEQEPVEPEAKTEAKTETAETVPETKTETEPETVPEAETETKTEPETAAKVEAETEVESETKTEAEAETKTEAETEAEAETESKAVEPETEVEPAVPETEAEPAVPEIEAEPAAPETETVPETEPEQEAAETEPTQEAAETEPEQPEETKAEAEPVASTASELVDEPIDESSEPTEESQATENSTENGEDHDDEDNDEDEAEAKPADSASGPKSSKPKKKKNKKNKK